MFFTKSKKIWRRCALIGSICSAILGTGCTQYKEVSLSETTYEKVPYQGQLPVSTLSQIYKQYPPGFWQNSQKVLKSATQTN